MRKDGAHDALHALLARSPGGPSYFIVNKYYVEFLAIYYVAKDRVDATSKFRQSAPFAPSPPMETDAL